MCNQLCARSHERVLMEKRCVKLLIKKSSNESFAFSFSMAESNLLSFVLELSLWLVAISELYSSRDRITIPLSVPD